MNLGPARSGPPASKSEWMGQWRGLPWRKILGSICVITGIGFTAWLAVLGSAEKPPSTSVNAVLVLASAISQVSGARFFNSVGRADPTLARSSVRRLSRMMQRAREARVLAERAFDSSSTKQELHDAIGLLSAHLSYFEEDAVMAIEDWKEFHKEALRAITQEESNG